MNVFRRIALLAVPVLALGLPALAQAQQSTKVSVSILYLTADSAIFLGIENGYFREQGLDVDLQRMTSGADAIALLATDKLDVGSGSLTPGLLNALRRGLPIQLVAEKASVRPLGAQGQGSGGLMIRRDLKESGAVKTVADLKGMRIGINNLQSTALNYVVRTLVKGGLRPEDVTLVELPFNQFVPALQKKAVDAVMAFPPLVQTIESKLKLAVSMPEGSTSITSLNDASNIMMYSSGFARSDAGKRFMVAHLKGQREYMRLLKEDPAALCKVVHKYIPAMPADCEGMSFTGVDLNGAINTESLERYQREWLQWGLMKEAADIRKSVNTEFVRHAVGVLGATR
jgi:NitT/TauT family transport system substrate-binding protein